MARTDLTIEELIDYRPTVAEPADFDDFWDETLSEARAVDLDVRLEPVETPYRTVDICDASFRGFAGDRINAWLLSPRDEVEPFLGVAGDAVEDAAEHARRVGRVHLAGGVVQPLEV